MLFNSFEFLVFLPIVFLLYWFVFRSRRWQNLLVVVASYVFYGWWDWRFLLLIAITSLCSFGSGLLLEHYKGQRRRQQLVSAANIVLNLGILGVFKYYNFFVENLDALFGAIGWHLDWVTMQIILPVGISFYTFQALSYTIDVYQKKLPATHDIVEFFAYISFFPQLVAGPIERATNLLPQFQRDRQFDYAKAVDGCRQMLWGFLKKLVIADNCAVVVNEYWNQYAELPGLTLFLLGVLFTFQIYCDFSGYSDMAIGIALLLGFQFPKNFDSPYKSASITEFWRRWHISLSSWLKDYLYISLGGNRHGKIRQYFNLLMTMLLGGLWHGASLNFILWGGIHGVLLCLDKMWHSVCKVLSPLTYLPSKHNPNPTKNWFVVLVGGIITFHLVAACWVLFRASSFGIAEQVFHQIFYKFEPQIFLQWCTSYKAVALLMLVGYVLHFMPEFLSVKAKDFVTRCPLVVKALLIVILVWIVIQIKSSDVQPFIYFQF